MKDIELAKELLINEELALVVVKDGVVIYKSRDRGIRPLFTAVKEMKESLKGASIADKVIGRAAAMLSEYGQIHELYTSLISEKAIEVLDNTDIIYSYEKAVPFIQNRDLTGLCPVENLSLKVDTIEDLIRGIEDFLDSISKKS